MTTESHNLNPNEHTRIAVGFTVSLHFEVGLENGVIVDSTFSRKDPVSFVIGDGSLLDGFESVLIGLRTGDKRTASLPASEAFGEWNPDNLQTFDKTQFALTSSNPQVGDMIEFADKGKNTLAGVVHNVEEDVVTIDFNHPLAGKNVRFTVEIFSVLPAESTAVRFQM